MNINIEKTNKPKQKPDPSCYGFGTYFSDHMFVLDYTLGKGWHDARIIPYGPFEIAPSNMALHYGQSVFEGMKAYKKANGKVGLFRPKKNMERLNITNDRMCIPQIDGDFILDALKKLLEVDYEWIPDDPGTSLYIRPFIFATDPYIGVRPSETYRFMIITGPVGAYYKEGIDPVKIFVETKYIRSVKGGVGNVKTSGNYAASIKAQMEAREKGYTQVLYLDGVERKYVEEVGTMNVFFIINNEIITPSLEGSILPGITRDSVIQMLDHWGMKVTERKISIKEVYDAHEKGILNEVFGTGTAAVISPVGELNWSENIIKINNGDIGPISRKLYDTITDIQYGHIEDPFGWTVEL